ncbi:MAG: hypothetical protein WAV76_04755 [Bacteroidota bacterium]
MKKKNVYVQGVFICIALAAVFILTGCSSAVKLTSDWKKSDIVIDGRPNDWDGSLYLLKKANVLVGVRNDSENLYICFITNDQSAQRQIMRNGLTLWFDPSGGTSERYGIKFPLGVRYGAPKESGNPGSGDAPPAIIDSTKGVRPPSVDITSRTGADDIQKSVQFVLTDEDRTQDLLLIELRSMEVKYTAGRNTFVYELKVPLHKTAEIPFELAPKDGVLGIGFKSDFKKETSTGGPSMSMGEPGGSEVEEPGSGRGGREGHGSHNHDSGSAGTRNSEELDVWLKETLAVPGTSM